MPGQVTTHSAEVAEEEEEATEKKGEGEEEEKAGGSSPTFLRYAQMAATCHKK